MTAYTYDVLGRLSAATNLALNAGTSYGYDAGGRRVAETNALGRVTLFDY